MILANNFEEVLTAFNDCKVNYIIAGGYAVVFHGYGRTTGDLDIWVKPVVENKERILAAFKKLQLSSELNEYISGLDFTKPFAVKLGDEPIQVDVFNAITGVKYNKAEQNSIVYTFSGNLEVRFMHSNDLITNKILTGKLQDRADAEELKRIRRYQNKK